MADESTAQTSAPSPKPDAPEAGSVAPQDEKTTGGDDKADAPAEGDLVVEEITVPGAVTVESSMDQKMNELPAEVKDDLGVDTGDKSAATNGAAEASTAPAEASAEAPAAGTPANSKNKKRRSSAGIPEHKNKKVSKRKSMPNLNLDVEPGQYWMARMKGHPPWPAIVCDEAMLPDTLLSKRPVSAMRPDGSYRDDYKDGGKNARDRRYPVMFLGTNEFYWIVNTDLEPLDMDDLKAVVEKDDRGKKSKALWEAYQIAAEDQDLDHFKNMLIEHEQARMDDLRAKQERETKKSSKKDKSKRKSTADEDVEMEDAEEEDETTKKASKKRKKDVESEGEGKTAKTPKTKVKINGPKPQPESSASKTKKATASKKQPEPEPEPPKIAAPPPRFADELKNGRFKQLYHIRSRLQRAFLTGPPKEDEMERMDETFKEAEEFVEGTPDVEGEVIKESRVHRVLKNIMKMGASDIPREGEFNFKTRASTLLRKFNKSLGVEGEAGTEASKADTPKADAPNGSAKAEKDETEASLSAAPEAKADEQDKEETKSVEPPATDKSDQAEKSADGDVEMKEAQSDEVERKEAEATA